MDVLYILGNQTRNDNLELRLSLRSLEKHGLGIDRVFVVGFKPDWICGVVHIEAEDNHTRENNAFFKVLLACQSDISDEFLFMNDDFFMTKDFEAKEYPHFVNSNVVFINNPSRYQEVQNKTLRYLKSQGVVEVMDYREHCPIRFDKEKILTLKTLYEESKESRIGYSLRLLYGNLFVKDYVIAPDVKLWNNGEIRENVQGCISTNDDCDDILVRLEEDLKFKSKYEK